MAKQSYAERFRAQQRKKAKEAATKTGADPREWVPSDGTHRIRILPPIQKDNPNYEEELKLHKKDPKKHPKPEQKIDDDFFYMTHAYHFLEGVGNGGKGTLLWTPRNFVVDGKTVGDPIDEAVSQLYETARREKNESMKKEAGKIKRKRQFFINIILYTENGPEYRILKDTSNEGKLVQQICLHMGFPFYRDVQDEWVIEESLEEDDERDYVDLVDVEVGHDFKIKREKTGSENWDISYLRSTPVKDERPLTDEERALLDERVDLRNYVQYCTYDQAKSALEEYFGGSEDGVVSYDNDDDDEEVEVPKAPVRSKKNRPKPKQEEVDDDDDKSIDDIVDELDDEDD